MTVRVLMLAAVVLAGCAGPTIYLRHPGTGHTATCTSSRWTFLRLKEAGIIESREECAIKWIKEGYVIEREE